MKKALLLPVLSLMLLLMAARPAAEVELIKKRVLSERVEILIPKGFEVMSEQQMDFLYAKAQSRPSLIYTNNKQASISFTYTDNTADQDMIQMYTDNFIKTYSKQFPDARWFGKGLKEISGRQVGYLELMKPELGHEVYNLIFFTDVEGKLLMCTFTCADRQKPEWEMVAKQIMNSFKSNG
ncbi:hypothetical protein FY528_03235 [Hymenobacter lutimineralis]|uniref:DUF1795 domain-containing protein n=1 Tax=Hymenobacter lutimineralis TaxID=2606448 RepID=A0A5D6VDL1_9BACT|nr:MULTISPECIES: hypothetical protein [Hymenobacter]QIX61219.1 hypothetical protein HER32_08515 [Hymenobacter sp. BT18]TYZ13435.1 hypothetical protein FY528_03235 [Hymenobacter lutimineralis]